MILLCDYLKSVYGEKVYKLSLSGKFTCPNRDGSKGYGGCIFCSAGGSGDFSAPAFMSLDEQIEYAKNKIASKYKGHSYIAYFQSFSNTYAPVDYLKSLYDPLTDYEDIKVIDIATRPDCINEGILSYLSELNKKKDVWVELGLQTSKPESIEYIRRGYDNAVYEKAIAELNSIGIHTVTHLILGLPKETEEDILNSVRYTAANKSCGIKLQLLHVLKGTALEADYKKGLFETLSFDEYIDLLKKCIAILPDNMVVHKLTGDGAKKNLIAPLWSADKKIVINRINRDVLTLYSGPVL